MPVDKNSPIEITAYTAVPPFAVGRIKDIRIRWALEEIERPYAVRLIEGIFEDKPQDYLDDQPFGQVPVYREGALTLFESGSILIHIGESDERLLPRAEVKRARILSWLVAALNSVEPTIQAVVVVTFFGRDADGKDYDWKDGAMGALLPFAEKRIAQLAAVLRDKTWLEGEFSIADIVMIDVLRNADPALIAPHANLVAYVERGTSRPAFKRAMEAHRQDCAAKQAEPA